MLRDVRIIGSSIGLLAALTLFTHSPPTLAQTDEQRAAARSLATDGAAAFNESRWKDAVDLFTRAEGLVHAPPHLLFLARAHHKLGQFVRAREAYLKVVKETLPPSAPQAFRDAQRAADQELREVEPKIASLTIKVQAPAGAGDVSVLVDGEPVPQVLVGVSRPIDPGDHRVEAVATGFRARPETVRLAEGERKAIVLTLASDPTAVPPTGAAPAPPGPAAPPPVGPTAATPAPAPAPLPPPSSEGNSGMRTGSYVAFGVGAVGLGLGTVFLLSSSSKRSDADAAYEDCSARNDCRENDASARRTKELDDDARSALTLSIVGFSVGAVGVGVGTALLLMSSGGPQEQPPTGFSVQPFVGFDRAGVHGTF